MALPAGLVQLIWQRAGARCEYCHLPSDADVFPFCVDHIIAQKHHGLTEAGNLALSCAVCNSFKLDNVAGVDPTSGGVTPLFHPRRDGWHQHFSWRGPLLLGITAAGRTTIDVLKINLLQRVDHRQFLILVDKFPQP